MSKYKKILTNKNLQTPKKVNLTKNSCSFFYKPLRIQIKCCIPKLKPTSNYIKAYNQNNTKIPSLTNIPSFQTSSMCQLFSLDSSTEFFFPTPTSNFLSVGQQIYVVCRYGDVPNGGSTRHLFTCTSSGWDAPSNVLTCGGKFHIFGF
jgi:hypothetical protein